MNDITITDENSAHGTTANATNNTNNVSAVDLIRLSQAAEVLRAAVSVAFQPTLRRLILGCDGGFVASLAAIIELLPKARAM